MKNEFLKQIKMIGDVLHHKSKPANQNKNIYKEVSHYSRHLISLTKELERAMFTKTELDYICYLIEGSKDIGSKQIDFIYKKAQKLSKIARETRYEKIKDK